MAVGKTQQTQRKRQFTRLISDFAKMSSPSISNNTAASGAGSSSSNNPAKEKEKENNPDDTFDQVMLCIVYAPSVH